MDSVIKVAVRAALRRWSRSGPAPGARSVRRDQRLRRRRRAPSGAVATPVDRGRRPLLRLRHGPPPAGRDRADRGLGHRRRGRHRLGILVQIMQRSGRGRLLGAVSGIPDRRLRAARKPRPNRTCPQASRRLLREWRRGVIRSGPTGRQGRHRNRIRGSVADNVDCAKVRVDNQWRDRRPPLNSIRSGWVGGGQRSGRTLRHRWWGVGAHSHRQKPACGGEAPASPPRRRRRNVQIGAPRG